MKKTIVVMLLTAILTACLIGGLGAVSAETQLYVAVSDLDVYVSRNGNYVKAFQIPKTYYFTSSGAAEGGYMRITYGSAEGDDLYVRSSDVAASAQTSDDDLSADPNNGAYIADGLTIPTDGITQLKVIFLGNNQFQDLNFTSFSVNRIYGIYTGTGENGDISESHFIDPAVGVYYVRYGNVYMIAEEDYALVGESDKGQFTALPTYDGKGKLIETFYITDKADIGGETLSGKILKYENVVTKKITQAEYDMLTEEEKAGYEAINNTYYLMMRVTDDREAATRFYETANYAFQNYTIIQKVIEIRVEASNADAKVLKVRTKINAGAENGNPYAIYYLHNTALDILGKVKSEIEAEYAEATYINSIYLASPNEDYFEIVIKFNEGYVETEETKEVIAELYYRALKELTTNEFIEETGIELSHINFDFANGSSTYDFNANDKDGMKEKLKTMWTTGVNVFDKAEIDESIESGETPYNVSYTLTFGDMKTRNGVLQLLSGKLRIIKVTGEDGTEKYSVNTWTLGHDSYTIDLSKGTITEENGEIKIA